MLAHVSVIADRVTDLAQWKYGCASWVGLAFGESYGWHLRPLTDLYSGLPGIVLFLAYAGAMTGREEIAGVAEATLATLRRQMKRRRAGLEFVGGFDGWGGLLICGCTSRISGRRTASSARPKGCSGRIEEVARSDRQMDVMQGNAGAIVPLLSLHKMTGSQGPLDLAYRLGDRLLQLARPCGDSGVGWLGAQYPDHPMTGFSHGSSGFAWALTELFAATGERAFADKALAAVRFERSHFSPETENWEDLRTSDGKDPMAAWCHGACGIGLSRACMQPYLDDEGIRQDLRAAVRTTYLQGFGSNHSLCHGDLGSLELLLQASRRLPQEEWGGRLAERTAQTVASIEEEGWLCGVPLDVETPGLMEGLAGIGLGLLRLAEPARVPGVLILEGPENLEDGARHVDSIFEGATHERIVGASQGREPNNPVGFRGSAVAGHF